MASASAVSGPSRERATSRMTTFLRWFGSLPRGAQVGAVIVTVFVLAALFAPLIAPHGENEINFNALLAAPSPAHLFGTDDAGRDIFSRVLYGLRIDLAFAALVTYVSLPLGVVAGAVAGYHGGITDSVISRFGDITIAFPFIVLIIAVVSIVGPGTWGYLIGVPIASFAVYARLARAQMLVLREQPFMLATKALGYSPRRAIFVHALPNVLRPCLVFSTLDLAGNLVLLASLSYLGLGIQPPTADLGSIIANGQPYLLSAWWISTIPGLVLVILGVGISLFGEGIADEISEASAR